MEEVFGEQTRIRCVQLRGGTSRGLYFHAEDLPNPGLKRDRLLQRLMGSPDVLEIDGFGGSGPITSKVAIVSRSQRQDADVDYTFAQVEIDKDGVYYGGNCGNISSGVGPFAVDGGLIEVTEGHTRVRICFRDRRASVRCRSGSPSSLSEWVTTARTPALCAKKSRDLS